MIAAMLVCTATSCSQALGAGPAKTSAVETNSLETILSSTNLTHGAAATNLYARHRIYINQKGSLDSKYDVVRDFANDYELISKIAECLIDSKMTLRKQKDGSYLYTNPDNDTSRLWVVHDRFSEDMFQGVYYFTGSRMFWDFEALVYLESKPNKKGGIEFDARIFADSGSAIARLLSKISFVKSYFARESTSVITQFDSVYEMLFKDPKENMEKIMQHRDPRSRIYFSDDEIEKIRRLYDTISTDDKK